MHKTYVSRIAHIYKKNLGSLPQDKFSDNLFMVPDTLAVATNVFDTTLTSDMFRELYFLRWPVETKYLELKKRLEIESFSGATTTSIFQEFYLNMLFSNLSSLIKNHVDELLDYSANPANKYRYQANRSFIIGQLKK